MFKTFRGQKIETSTVLGSSFGDCLRIEIGQQAFFGKVLPESDLARLHAEEEGLGALASVGAALVIPATFGIEVADGKAMLLMEWLEQTQSTLASWEALGHALADLHANQSEAYGFSNDNYIGSSVQDNTPSPDWVEFFADRRLTPQMEMAKVHGLWDADLDLQMRSLIRKLPEILPKSPAASILHGDLWSGNCVFSSKGPAIFDPAVYYGDRETDLAMTKLFGGFPGRFYDAYSEAWPLSPEWETRVDVYNLYHLLNHLNIFGSSYHSSVSSILKRYA